MILDATAGNRMMWAHTNKQSDYVVFLDKENGLSIPPDVIGVWEFLPFRPKVFWTTLFDPPHSRFGKNSIHQDRKGIRGRWWGILPRLKTTWLVQFKKASKEFARVSDVLCFKWNETSHLLGPILPIFKPEWALRRKKEIIHPMKRGKQKTFWITFKKSEFNEKGEENVS